MLAIKVENLSKDFEYYKKDVGLKNSIKNLFKREKLIRHAVNDISFEINEGEMVGFLGPNGAGKTTTLKMLSGIIYPTNGKLNVLGYTPFERKKDFKKQFSIIMGQKSQLWWDLPANESLYLNKCIYEVNDDDFNHTVNELAEALDIKDLLKVQVRRLSLGERMKMELIAGLVHKPKLILLDEPTIGLDVISQKKVRKFLKYYNEKNKITVILTSHYMNDIEDLCDRTIVINKGSLAYDGKLLDINETLNSRKLIKIKFEKIIDNNELKQFGQIRSNNGYCAILDVPRQELKEISKSILNALPVLDLNIEDIPLEDSISLLYQSREDDADV